MTEIDYKVVHQHWRDFAKRMINVVTTSNKRRKELLFQAIFYIDTFEGEKIEGWDNYVHDSVHEYWDDLDPESLLFQQITCVIRAALDVALPTERSTGVGGFTVGDLRKMYPEGIPDWVKSFFDPPFNDNAENSTPIWL